MTVGERLLNLRKEKRLSQEELANILDVSRQTISKWETDQSTPDFDKIVPLCNYFGITTDELLTGRENIKEANKDDRKKRFAKNIAISVGMYILSVISIILCTILFNAPEIGVCVFFVIIALATALIIYNGIVNGDNGKEETNETKEDKDEKLVKEIVSIIGTIIYFLVSFLTMAWHLTWIIFLIIGLVNTIVSLLFSIKNSKKESDING